MDPRTSVPPAGWYPDPAGGGGLRWWDGVGWSAATDPAGPTPSGQVATPPPTPGAPLPEPPQFPSGATPMTTPVPSWYPASGAPVDAHRTLEARALVEAEQRMTDWGRWALVGMACAALAAAAVAAANWSHFAAFFHWYRLVFDASRHGGTPPPIPAGAKLPVVVDIPGLVLLGAEIVFVVWQHRAATAARALGLPARRSPRAGVVLWFVPIANLWCPYQSIRDCLPPGHPDRPRVLRFWLALVAGELCGGGAVVAGAFARPAGIALIVVAAAFWLVAVVGGRRVVEVSGDVHRTLAGPKGGHPGRRR